MQLKEIHNELIEVTESTKIPAVKSEANSLAEHEISYEFVLNSVLYSENDLLKSLDLNKVLKE